MPGDYSRDTFRKDKHYSAVLIEQGRVQLDADSREQVAIDQHRAFTEATDVIGVCGVPEGPNGFQIGVTPDGTDLTISPGRIYSGGLMCELESSSAPVVALHTQQRRLDLAATYVDGRALDVGQWIELAADNVQPVLLQIAGVDAEQGTVSVSGSLASFSGASSPRIRRVTTYLTQPDYPDPEFAAPPLSPDELPSLHIDVGTYAVYVDAWQREITALEDPLIREVALGGPDTAARLMTIAQVRMAPVATGPSAPTCESAFPRWDPPTGVMNARTAPPQGNEGPCQLPPSVGFETPVSGGWFPGTYPVRAPSGRSAAW